MISRSIICSKFRIACQSNCFHFGWHSQMKYGQTPPTHRQCRQQK
jgi:hypothetical protein